MTALKLFLCRKSSRAIASFCCCWVESPGFDGQLMFATEATQAARNSLVGCVGCSPGSTTVLVAFFFVLQAANRQSNPRPRANMLLFKGEDKDFNCSGFVNLMLTKLEQLDLKKDFRTRLNRSI